MKVLKSVWSFVVDFFTILQESKKAKALVAGLIVAAFAGLKMDMEQESVVGVLTLIGVYILGQGRADTGKEAVKLQLQDRDKNPSVLAVVTRSDSNEDAN